MGLCSRSRIRCKTTSISSLVLMTCMSSAPQNVWSPFTSSSNRLWRGLSECVGSFLLYANSQATYSLRSIRPLEAAQFAAAHDDATWSSLTGLAGLPFATERQGLASFPFASGGCGLRSAMRSRVPARWASWADSLRMIQRPHPVVANIMIRCLSDF